MVFSCIYCSLCMSQYIHVLFPMYPSNASRTMVLSCIYCSLCMFQYIHVLFPMYVPIHTCIVPYVSQQCKYVPRQLFNWSKITPNGVFAWMYCFLHGILRGYVRNNTYMQTHHSFTYRHSVSICHCRHIWCVCMYVLFLTYPLSIPATKAVSRQSFEKLNNCLGNIYTFAGGILRAPYYMTYIGNNTYT